MTSLPEKTLPQRTLFFGDPVDLKGAPRFALHAPASRGPQINKNGAAGAAPPCGTGRRFLSEDRIARGHPVSTRPYGVGSLLRPAEHITVRGGNVKVAS